MGTKTCRYQQSKSPRPTVLPHLLYDILAVTQRKKEHLHVGFHCNHAFFFDYREQIFFHLLKTIVVIKL
jgi:hypothetical protein